MTAPKIDTAEQLLAVLRAGVPVRWLPKNIVYNEQHGPNIRFLFIGKRMIVEHEEQLVICNAVRKLKRDGLVRERCDGPILRIELDE